MSRAVELKTVLSQSKAKPETDISVPVGNPSYLVGETPPMQEVFKAIGKSAGLNIPVLIRGENGTGKESVARAIHDHSAFSAGPFIKLHCPAFDEPRFEAELFGIHDARGHNSQIGKIQLAAEGTLMLQEIGNLPLSMQTKILQAVREGVFDPIGSETSMPVRCRVLMTSSQDLERRAREGHMRADLYYLLSAFVIALPPLRQRRDDLPLLIDHLLKHSDSQGSGDPTDTPQVSQEALERLCKHTWPGNIDELYSALKRSLIDAKGNTILADTLNESLTREPVLEESRDRENGSRTDWSTFVDLRVDAGVSDLYSDALSEMERRLLPRILQHTSGNQAQAAKILGITRTSLRKKLRQLNINVQHIVRLGETDRTIGTGS